MNNFFKLIVVAFLLMSILPFMAFGGTVVNLHGPHVGADSTDFQEEGDTGGLTDAVVWHFILNQLDHGTEPATLTVTFQNAGVQTAIGIPVGVGATQHFYVGTSGHDILLSGYAEVNSEGYGNLVLSHVAFNDPVDPVDPPPSVDPTLPVDPPPSVDPTLPVDPVDPPPSIDPTLPVDPIDPPPSVDPTLPADPTVPAEPAPRAAPVDPVEQPSGQERVISESESVEIYRDIPEELPYTGAPLSLLYLAAGFGLSGLALRRMAG